MSNIDGKQRVCDECGGPVTSVRAHARFCQELCRKRFGNRRQLRGAELVGVAMALRYDRAWASEVGLWQMYCRLLASWHREDQLAGRVNARPVEWVSANRCNLRAGVVA